MSIRVGVFDIGALGALVIALVLPTPSGRVSALYVYDRAALVPVLAESQAELMRNPTSGKVAARLADELVRARQTDWALRVGAQASTRPSPDRWRVMVAVSAAHADRVEIGPAYQWAEKALMACQEPGAECADYEKSRLEMYVTALKAGFDSGIDPTKNSKGFKDAVDRAVPLIRLGKPGTPASSGAK